MSFSVQWQESAENELAQIWIDAEDRSLITATADQIDKLLVNDPESLGESRGGSNRILIERPLAVLYRVEKDQRILVLKITYSPRRKR